VSAAPTFEAELVARAEHIDELDHVNNAVWVQWVQDVAVAHWRSVAAPEHDAAYFWVVVRHEIDYLRPAFEGDRITARTWIDPQLQGARSTRHMEFLGPDGKVLVRARTQWAIIDKTAGRPVRVPREVVAPFLPSD
jgi:acyl-CoA thioester hydrolase